MASGPSANRVSDEESNAPARDAKTARPRGRTRGTSGAETARARRRRRRSSRDDGSDRSAGWRERRARATDDGDRDDGRARFPRRERASSDPTHDDQHQDVQQLMPADRLGSFDLLSLLPLCLVNSSRTKRVSGVRLLGAHTASHTAAGRPARSGGLVGGRSPGCPPSRRRRRRLPPRVPRPPPPPLRRLLADGVRGDVERRERAPLDGGVLGLARAVPRPRHRRDRRAGGLLPAQQAQPLPRLGLRAPRRRRVRVRVPRDVPRRAPRRLDARLAPIEQTREGRRRRRRRRRRRGHRRPVRARRRRRRRRRGVLLLPRRRARPRSARTGTISSRRRRGRYVVVQSVAFVQMRLVVLARDAIVHRVREVRVGHQ